MSPKPDRPEWEHVTPDEMLDLLDGRTIRVLYMGDKDTLYLTLDNGTRVEIAAEIDGELSFYRRTEEG